MPNILALILVLSDKQMFFYIFLKINLKHENHRKGQIEPHGYYFRSLARNFQMYVTPAVRHLLFKYKIPYSDPLYWMVILLNVIYLSFLPTVFGFSSKATFSKSIGSSIGKHLQRCLNNH